MTLFPGKTRLPLARWRVGITVLLLVLAGREAVLQREEAARVRAFAGAVVREAGAATPRAKAIALRDYLRANVTHIGAPVQDRPFLRATAGETLASGQGYCGEVSRVFICMARSQGIPAQRINLFGRQGHTVAEVDLGPEGLFIVDCQSPPTIPDLERLDDVIRRPEYSDYSTLNLRRTGLEVIFSRLKFQLGYLTYLTENPHAIMAAFWAGLLGLFWTAVGLRRAFRWVLARRGWVHVSNSAAAAKIRDAQASAPPGPPAA
jgi:hypothetical protein